MRKISPLPGFEPRLVQPIAICYLTIPAFHVLRIKAAYTDTAACFEKLTALCTQFVHTVRPKAFLNILAPATNFKRENGDTKQAASHDSCGLLVLASSEPRRFADSGILSVCLSVSVSRLP